MNITEQIEKVAKDYNKTFYQVANDFRALLDMNVLVDMYARQRKSTTQLLELAAGMCVVCTKAEMMNIIKSGYFDNIEIEKHGSEYKLKSKYKKAPL